MSRQPPDPLVITAVETRRCVSFSPSLRLGVPWQTPVLALCPDVPAALCRRPSRVAAVEVPRLAASLALHCGTRAGVRETQTHYDVRSQAGQVQTQLMPPCCCRRRSHCAAYSPLSPGALPQGAGFRDFCFVKMSTSGTTPEGKPIVGWSEYLEERNIGITQVIEWLGQLVVGQDPLPFGRVVAQLKANTRHIVGGIANQGIAAIENALLDIVGKVRQPRYP